MAVASFFFFLMGMMVKLSSEIPTIQIVFLRGVVAMLICLVQLRVAKISPWGSNKKLLITRGLCGTAALFLFFTTLQQIPFVTAVTLQNLAPIFTTIFTAIILKEVFYTKQAFFFIAAFTGIIMIKGFDGGLEILPYVLGFASAMFSAGAYTAIRKFKESEHPLVIIFYFPLIIIPVTLPFVFMNWVRPTLEQWGYLVGVGVFVQLAQYFMTRSYQMGDASIVSIAGYLSLVWATLGGYYLFDEKPTGSVISGVILVVLSVVGNLIYTQYEHKRTPKRSQEQTPMAA